MLRSGLRPLALWCVQAANQEVGLSRAAAVLRKASLRLGLAAWASSAAWRRELDLGLSSVELGRRGRLRRLGFDLWVRAWLLEQQRRSWEVMALHFRARQLARPPWSAWSSFLAATRALQVTAATAHHQMMLRRLDSAWFSWAGWLAKRRKLAFQGSEAAELLRTAAVRSALHRWQTGHQRLHRLHDRLLLAAARPASGTDAEWAAASAAAEPVLGSSSQAPAPATASSSLREAPAAAGRRWGVVAGGATPAALGTFPLSGSSSSGVVGLGPTPLAAALAAAAQGVADRACSRSAWRAWQGLGAERRSSARALAEAALRLQAKVEAALKRHCIRAYHALASHLVAGRVAAEDRLRRRHLAACVFAWAATSAGMRGRLKELARRAQRGSDVLLKSLLRRWE
ncbi:unnamed protein product, partial [Polarella glacialis]